jgi:hemerythrin-like domain-containing protein
MASKPICFHFLNGTCKYEKCYKQHLTQTQFREMNKYLSPCFSFCATGVCNGHGDQGCLFAKKPEDYIEACKKRGKVVDQAVVMMLEQGVKKEKMIGQEPVDELNTTNQTAKDAALEKVDEESKDFVEEQEKFFEEAADEYKRFIEDVSEKLMETPKQVSKGEPIVPGAPRKLAFGDCESQTV